MTYPRIPKNVDPFLYREMDRKFKRFNYQDLSTEDRVRCQACYQLYFRLWHDRCQCLSCGVYTRFETKGGGDLKETSWIQARLEADQTTDRVKCPRCRKCEYSIFKKLIKCRWCREAFPLQTELVGFWLLENLMALHGDERLEELRTQLTKGQLTNQIRKARRKEKGNAI